MRKLLLEQGGFPAKFNKVDIELHLLGDLTQQQFIEALVLEKLNARNAKLNVEQIDYVNIEQTYPSHQSSKFTGLIVEQLPINEQTRQQFNERDTRFFYDDEQLYAEKIIAYVHLSEATENSRTSLFTQSIFPHCLDYMPRYLSGPSYTIYNHPVYFINIINKKITAQKLIRVLAMIAKGLKFEYIEIFPGTMNIEEIPASLRQFLTKYDRDHVIGNIYENDFISVDFAQKIFSVKAEYLALDKAFKYKSDMTLYEFNGSREKFYWIEVLPTFLMALEEGYDVHYDTLKHFCETNETKFSQNDKKFQRFKYLIDYLDKLTMNEVF